ncbi:hypothetical protein CVT25_002048 [Psilocybe cyanescens]|uniref:Uncharacterized protein n=1 Tax=Psilocybe cyanescens TaxID=93625 RepID=A0A409VT75_PSICY|nr:hypothetical protein CVT25_002048 [Psilocybe cyanescens]
MFSSTKAKALHPTSRSNKHSSSLYDGRMSFNSDSSTLLNVGIPSYPTKLASSKNGRVTEDDMLDPEDRAWGPPPPMNFKWSLPKFSRKSSSRS